jgi:hypothetical protein
MMSKRHMKRNALFLVITLLISLVFAMPAQSAINGLLKVTERLSNASPASSTTIHISVCWVNAQRGDVVELDEQSSSTLLWKAVSHEVVTTARGCEALMRLSGPIGRYPYRAEVLHGKSVLGASSVTVERTFGTISAASFFGGEFGCQGGGTVSTGVETYNYFCSLRAGSKSQSDYVAFPRPTTCRSLTLSMIATGDVNGNPADHSTMVVEIQQDNTVQSAIFTDNELENFTYHLSSHAAALNIWDSPGNSDGDSAFFLSNGSTAICSSRTGV